MIRQRVDERPRETRSILPFETLVRRIGAAGPLLFLVDDMPADRVVSAAFDFGSARPLDALVMQRETYRRAIETAYCRWGVGIDGVPGAREWRFVEQFGRQVVVPVALSHATCLDSERFAPCGVYDWRIDL